MCVVDCRSQFNPFWKLSKAFHRPAIKTQEQHFFSSMKGFLDPKVEELLADKSETERLQAIVFSIACLLNGPTAFQPPDFYHIPKRSGKI